MEAWAEEAARLTKPDRVIFCDGSEAENEAVHHEMLKHADSLRLNEKTYPNCYLHRSSPSDVARTEHLTFICAPDKDDGKSSTIVEYDLSGNVITSYSVVG